MAKLTIEIGAKIDAMQRGLANARAGLNGFAKSVSGAFTTGAKAGIAAMATGVAMMLQKSVKLAAAMEQTQVSFRVMTGSADKARAMVEALTQFANSTPFESAEIMKSAKVLMGFGVAAKDILPTLRLLGDVSAGTGKDLTELAVIFGQIRGNGKLMGGDLLQLINAGFNPLLIISKQTGRSMADLRKDMEAGLITFDMVEGAFKSATSEGGLFFNMMQEQSQTLNGKLSTLNDSMAKIGLGIGNMFLDELKALTDQAIELAGALDEVNTAKGLTGAGAGGMSPEIIAPAPTLENELPVGYRERRDRAAQAVANIFEALEKTINSIVPEALEGESIVKAKLRELVEESKRQLELEGKLFSEAPSQAKKQAAATEKAASDEEARIAADVAERKKRAAEAEVAVSSGDWFGSPMDQVREAFQNQADQALRNAKLKQQKEQEAAAAEFGVKGMQDALESRRSALEENAALLQGEIGDMFRPQEIKASRLAGVGGEAGIIMDRQIPVKQLEMQKATLEQLKKIEERIKETQGMRFPI